MKEKIYKLLQDTIKDGNGLYQISDLESYVDKITKLGSVISITDADSLKAFLVYYANNKQEKQGFLSMIIVAPDARRLGYGRRLVEFCLTDLKFKGFNSCKTEVHKLNIASLNVCKRCGFTEYSRKGDSIFLEWKLD